MSLRYIKISKYVQLHATLSLSRRITSYFNEHIEASMAELNLSYCHTPSTSARIIYNSFTVALFSF